MCIRDRSKGVPVKSTGSGGGTGTGTATTTTTVVEGVICDPKESLTGKSSSGKELTCLQGVDGKYAWQPPQSGGGTGGGTGGGGTGSGASSTDDKSYLYGKRLGMSCSKDGVFGLVDGALAVCANAKVRYAMPSDIQQLQLGDIHRGHRGIQLWLNNLVNQNQHAHQARLNSLHRLFLLIKLLPQFLMGQ